MTVDPSQTSVPPCMLATTDPGKSSYCASDTAAGRIDDCAHTGAAAGTKSLVMERKPYPQRRATRPLGPASPSGGALTIESRHER
ncbi:MAG: hypothetical protein ACI841_000320 [Planctomycetota bacterium]|jgi:hypothetical protein